MLAALSNLMAETAPSIPVVPIGDYAQYGPLGYAVLGGIIAATLIAATWKVARSNGHCRADALVAVIASLTQKVDQLAPVLAVLGDRVGGLGSGVDALATSTDDFRRESASGLAAIAAKLEPRRRAG